MCKWSLRKKSDYLRTDSKQENLRKSPQALHCTHTNTLAQRLQYEYSTHADTQEHTEGRQQEEQWGLCALSTEERWRVWNYDPKFLFVCSTSGASIATTGTHLSFDGECVYTTYPQCTATTAHSTPQWIPRWPAHCHQVALWRWCDESSPLAPRKRKKQNNTWNCEVLKTCLLFLFSFIAFPLLLSPLPYMLKYASLKLGKKLINSIFNYNYANKANEIFWQRQRWRQEVR